MPKKSQLLASHLLLHIADVMSVESRIQSANILLITFKALANEVAKNLVLAGIGTLTIVDHELVTEEDLAAQLFLEERHVGQNVR